MRSIHNAIIVLLLVLLPLPHDQYHAEVKHVTDCLEGENCEELNPTKEIELNNSNDMLIENEKRSSTSFFFNFVKMIFALLLVLGLVYLVLIFMKKRNRFQLNHQLLDNLGGISLGANKSVQLIKVGDKVYLIGVGDNVELMKEITDETLKDTLFNEAEEQEPLSQFFQSVFQSKNKTKDTKVNQFTQTFKEELSKLQRERNALINEQKVKDDNNE